jgi:F-type H+-transporting ATPase subunit epsilon
MPLRLDIVTVERVVYSEDVDIVVAPGIEGQLGILPQHAPLLTALTYGELWVRQKNEEFSFAIGGGFMEVRPNRVTVLADTAERAEEIDLERAEAARRRAQERLHAQVEREEDFARAEAALQRAATRIKVAETRRRRGRRRGEAEQPGARKPPE